MANDPKLLSPCRVKIDRINFHTPPKQLALSAELRKVINERQMLTANSRKKYMMELQQIEAKKRETEKRNALQEILTSELAYINQIELIQNFFMKPIKQRQLLKANEFDTLFGNINSIYQVNGALLKELKEDLMHLTSAFHKMAPFLKLYSEYAFNFMNAMSMLNQLKAKNVEFSKFAQGQETRPEVQSTLTSLLIAPIQRIPRYCLLIKQVLDNTSVMDESYRILKETYYKLNDVAKHLDTAVAERQKSEEILTLASQVKHGKTLIIQPGRRLIMHGVVEMYNKGKPNASMYMILFSDIVMLCTIKKVHIEQTNSLKCKLIFPLRKCHIKQNSDLMIHITCEDEKITVFSKDGQTNEWMKSLKSTLREYIANRSTLRKGSSSRRPAVGFNFEAYKNPGVSPGVPGLRKRRRFDEFEDDEENNAPQEEEVQEVKRSKMVECRKSIKSMIPKLNKPKALLRGLRTKSTNEKKPAEVNEVESVETAKVSKVTKESDKQHENNEETNDVDSEINQTVKKDALFPLRTHFLERSVDATPSTSSQSSAAPSSTALVPYAPNLFVFGRENNRPSGFSFSGVISGLTNSFKRVFGFR